MKSLNERSWTALADRIRYDFRGSRRAATTTATTFEQHGAQIYSLSPAQSQCLQRC